MLSQLAAPKSSSPPSKVRLGIRILPVPDAAPLFSFGSEKHKDGRKYGGTLVVGKDEWRSHPEKNDKVSYLS